jgi:hypothetical protein
MPENLPYTLSLWLLMPCCDDPTTLTMAGLLTEADSMSEAAARAAFAAATYASEMEEIEHENEPVMLSLDLLDADGIGISQESRTLYANVDK